MATLYSTSTKEGVDINSVFYLDTTAALEYPAPAFNPGELAWGTDGSEWVFVTSSISINAGAALYINASPGSWSVALVPGGTVLAVAGSSAPGFGQLVCVAGGGTGTLTVSAPSGTQTANYFWAQRLGDCPNLLYGGTGTGTLYSQLYNSKTLAGGLQQTSPGAASGFAVNGVVFTANASVAGPNTAVLNYPVIGVEQ